MSHTGSSAESVTALLELTASQRPELLGLQLQTVSTSAMRSTLYELAHTFDVPPERVRATVAKACQDLDRLEGQRGKGWRDPKKVLEAPNVAALFHLCRARVGRISTGRRRRHLESIVRKLKLARDLDRNRAWIEDFIGLPQTTSRGHG